MQANLLVLVMFLYIRINLHGKNLSKFLIGVVLSIMHSIIMVLFILQGFLQR